MIIRDYSDLQDRAAVIELWTKVSGPATGHNEPAFAIAQKLKVADVLFFVATETVVIGTIMAGYDGCRGWIYSVSVASEWRMQGVGAALMRHAESALVERGCAKVNLQVVDTNAKVVGFYEALGYVVEARISLGKKLSKPKVASRMTE